MNKNLLTTLLLMLLPWLGLAQSLSVQIPNDSIRGCAFEPLMISATVSGGALPYSFVWSNGDVGDSTWYVSGPGGSYLTVTVTDGFGNTASDSIWIHIHNACVWPGDANGDGIANNFDILPIGLAYGASGPVRPDAHLQWIAQPADNWNLHTPDGVDYVHADADGNGGIDSFDVEGITHNYLVPQTQPGVSGSIGGGVPLIVDFPVGNYSPGDTIEAAVMLGTSQFPADSVYGIAFSVEYDGSLFEPGSLTVRYDSSWLGEAGVDMITVDRNFDKHSQVDIGISRTNQQWRAGFGQIATIIVTVDDIAGKNNGIEMVNFAISRVSMTNETGAPIKVSPGLSQVGITLSNQPELPDFVKEPRVYPNPATNHLIIDLEDNRRTETQIAITDITGKQLIQTSTNSQIYRVDVATLPRGTYFLEVFQHDQRYTKILQLE